MKIKTNYFAVAFYAAQILALIGEAVAMGYYAISPLTYSLADRWCVYFIITLLCSTVSFLTRVLTENGAFEDRYE